MENIAANCRNEWENRMKRYEEISGEIKQTKKDKLIERMVITFGGIELDKDEKSFLALGPDYAIYEDIKMDDLEKEIQLTATKIRWARMNKVAKDIVNMRNIDDVIEEEEAEEEIHMCKHVFKEENMEIDLGFIGARI